MGLVQKTICEMCHKTNETATYNCHLLAAARLHHLLCHFLKTSDFQKSQQARYCTSGLLEGLILERWATGHKMVMEQELINAHPFNQPIHQERI
jgi:hypothetical protein